ncbi:hypothetical protein FJT64_004463 [Amphibalanus amphitrite]|uniref:Uncharacterized protein n=1 Tax=Amphibalanus amphitrite TaxID=1232801 RepID=A0A6A4VWZ5_AMPAM|nr:hypothetical protein FJT64_004463 [Amphibalanus amphitrite]
MLSSRQAERRAPGPEESRRSGSVRRPPEEPAPLHRAGSARLPAGYEAQYDEQSLMNPPLDRHAPPPPAPPSGQYHQQADRRQHQSNGVVRPGPGVQTASPPDSGGAGRQQRPGSRRGLPKSVSGPLSGDYDSLYDSPYDAVYDRPNGYDPPPYVPPAPPPAGADQWRGADWPGRAGGAAYPPSRHDWNRDGRGGSARHRAGSQQDVRSALGASQQDMRSALTASQQDMRSALTASQQDMRSALAASYQAYRRASGALADGGDSERRLQAVLRQYRSQQDLGSAGDSAGRYGPYRHARGLSYGQEMAGAYYQERGGRHAEEHWRTKGPSGPNGPHGNGSVHGPQYFPVQQNGQQSTNESQNRSPPSGNVQTSSFQGNGSDPANQRSPQQPTPQSTQVSTSETAEQLEETPELTARPAPTGAESQQSTGGRTTQEETSAAGTATEAATDGATEPSGVDTRSVGTVGQRVAVWESKGPAPPAPSGQSNGNGSSTGQQRQQTGGAQERPEEDQAEEYQTQEAMGPLYALLARDRGSLEVKTVRTVKRESQQRQREKGRQASLENVPSGGEVPSDGEEEDPLVTDPVLSQFQRALSLPRGYGGRRASEQDNSQQRHHMLKRLVDQRRPAERRPSAYERLFGSTPELRAAAGPAGAAAERQDLSLRRVPRRHHTLSVGSRLAVRRLSDAAAAHGASAEELPTEPRPPLRQASSTPDIVRASRPGLATKYDEDTIDKLLARPQKIRIPERYVPELVSSSVLWKEVEPMSVEERLQRSRKAASIRKMLTQSTGFLDTIGSQTGEKEPRVRPGVAATDKLQRAHLLQLNEILARQVTEQSKRVAAANSSPE